MKKSSLWIIRVALTVQFICVLAVPALVAAAESPRAVWLAEWVNPNEGLALSESRASLRDGRLESNGRTIGVLKLRDGVLSFDEQVGHVAWAVDLSSVKRVVVSDGALRIESNGGQTFVIAVLDSNMTLGSPKPAMATIDRALRVAGASASR